MFNAVKGQEFEEGETVAGALVEEEFSTDHHLSSERGGNWI